MTDQQKNYQQWAECYTDELICPDCLEPLKGSRVHICKIKDNVQAFDANKFKLKDGKLESIEQTLEERGQQYGSFKEQSICVGGIINHCIWCAEGNNKELTNQQIGSIAYIAIKLARFAVNPNHLDSMHDLEAYAHLINELYNGEKNV